MGEQAAGEAQAARLGVVRGSAAYRRVLLALGCAGVATFAQLHSPQGVLTLLAADLRVTPATSALAVSAATAGLTLGLLPWSWIGDRVGRTTAMRVALLVACGLGLALPFAPTMGAVVALRVVEGFALGGVPALAVTYLAEELSAAAAVTGAAAYISGTSLGGLAGRLLAAPVGEAFGWRVGLGAVSVLSLAAVAGFVLLAPVQARPASPARAVDVVRATVAHLHDRRLLVLFAQGALLMGAFVIVYNYLAFRLEAPPYLLPTSVTSLLFLAYLSGTASARGAGRLAGRWGRRSVLMSGGALVAVGALLTLARPLGVVVAGLVVLTAGFFAAHAVAAGWVATHARVGRAQASALYNMWYYGGLSVFGWFGGVAWGRLAWPGVVGLVCGLALVAVLAASRLPAGRVAAAATQSVEPTPSVEPTTPPPS